MSKLRDRMREMSRRRTAAFGFAVARDAERVPRQVLVIAEVDSPAAASAAAEAGADALLYTGAGEGFADVRDHLKHAGCAGDDVILLIEK